VATDRISAFDCIMPNGIPDKGGILTQISNFWFDRLAGIVPNHVVAKRIEDYPAALRDHAKAALLARRSVLVRKASVLPIECVVRGYLAGSGWRDYKATGMTSGVRLPEGLQLASRLDEPVFSPSSKAESGHDENITAADVSDRVGAELADRLASTSKALYCAARDHAESVGLILADTKFEFGLADGELILVDEALTPDSSRFWDIAAYAPGRAPENFDKQVVRDYLDGLDWDKTPPAPALPDEIVKRTRGKYLEAYRRLTGTEY
jgi:phosphoribosylaminoimidazole-succinocarboxamide synthase